VDSDSGSPSDEDAEDGSGNGTAGAVFEVVRIGAGIASDDQGVAVVVVLIRVPRSEVDGLRGAESRADLAAAST